MNGWLSIPSFLFEQGVRIRGRLYDQGWLSSVKVDRPVISVGNLTVGGTGKTPFSMWLIGKLKSRGLQPAFVSRGYGSGTQAARAVTHVDARKFGDEPSLVRESFPDLPVYIGADRSSVIAMLLSQSKPDIIVADDAFQHRRLKRDLDIVILDALEPSWHYDFLPKGRAREDFASLSRAQFVVISKHNLASPEQIQFLEKNLAGFSGRRLNMLYYLDGFRKKGQNAGHLDGKLFLVTGVGRPESVSALVKPLKHKTYPDHYSYNESDVTAILEAFKESGAQHLVTTGKDAVKLRKFSRLRELLWEINLRVEVQGDIDELDRETDRLARPRN
jgi:tetraacyldisaccharide 4'-kinase